MQTKNIQHRATRIITFVNVSLILYGALHLNYSRLWVEEKRAAMVESITLPIDMENIRAIREGDTNLKNTEKEPNLVNEVWRERADKVVKSKAFASLLANNAQNRASNPAIGFDQAQLVRSFYQMPGERGTETKLRNVMFMTLMQAAANEGAASFRFNREIYLGGFYLIFGLVGLLLWSPFSKKGSARGRATPPNILGEGARDC